MALPIPLVSPIAISPGECHRATEYLANLRLALALHPEINNLPIALRVPVEGRKIVHGRRSLRPGSLTRLASPARALTGVSTAGGLLGSPDHEQIPEQTSAAGVAADPPQKTGRRIMKARLRRKNPVAAIAG